MWAEDDEVLNVNEAHAYASCSDCVAVAVAFQVVLIMDDAQVIIPQNLAVAANFDCYQCITAAVASQLVLSVEGEPGEEDLLALGAVWNRLLQFASTITSRSLTEITDQLDDFKAEIVAILMDAPPADSAPSGSATVPTDPSAEVSGSPSTSATGAPSLSPAAEPTTTAPMPTSEATSTAPPQTGENTAPPSATEATTEPPSPTEATTEPASPTQTEPWSPTASSTSPGDSTSPAGSASP